MGGFRLGSLLGIEIRVDFSWFVIFFLILWSFSSAVFPAQLPGLPRGSYVVMGVSGALLFFLSLLAHEMSHSVVARARGIPVHGITLFIFGGMAQTAAEAEGPGDEFLIAVVGPLMSFLIAGLLGAVYWFGLHAQWNVTVLAVAGYLAVLNAILAIFNLLPGFPLDGGRLLRAVVWKVSGNLMLATRVASIAGQVIAYALIAWGAYQTFTGDLVGGIWMILIGWFLRNTAIAAYRQHVMRESMTSALVRGVMTPAPRTVPPELTLEVLMQEHFLAHRDAAFAVADGEAPLGIVTLQQLRGVPHDAWARTRVYQVMVPATADLVVSADAPMADALRRLQRSPVRRLLVATNGRLEGMLSTGDVARWLEAMSGGKAAR